MHHACMFTLHKPTMPCLPFWVCWQRETSAATWCSAAKDPRAVAIQERADVLREQRVRPLVEQRDAIKSQLRHLNKGSAQDRTCTAERARQKAKLQAELRDLQSALDVELDYWTGVNEGGSSFHAT
jgi:hypothetical protein